MGEIKLGPREVPYWFMNAYIFNYQKWEEVMECAVSLLDYWGMAYVLRKVAKLDYWTAWSIDEFDLVQFGYHEW